MVKVFDARVLLKYRVSYHKCSECGFIQTEQPFWLHEAYSSAITKLDIGLISRNILCVKEVEKMFNKKLFDASGMFVDYGGGYGMFVRMMRDKGFDYYRQDIYCENLFAEYFDISDLPVDTRFEILTAFEVFEHLIDPLKEVKRMLAYSDNIVFSTELQPASIEKVEDWWYFAPETGQHIALFSLKSLQKLAEIFDLNLYTNNSTLHILTKKKLKKDPFAYNIKDRLFAKIKSLIIQTSKNGSNSLLKHDYEYIKSVLKNFN